ncbi:MAG: RNA polymerase sigma factor [Minisyncoccota bacterium]
MSVPVPKTDQELVQESLANRHAFAALVAKYEAPLRRYVKRLGVDSPEDAEDLLQEAFIKAYVNLNDYDPSLPFGAWMYRITHNETISHFRKQRVRPRTVETEENLVMFENIADDSDIPAEIDREILKKAIHTALAGIAEQYRDVLVLRFLEEKSYDEIAEILQIPSGTVATYISRGKRELKEALKRFASADV